MDPLFYEMTKGLSERANLSANGRNPYNDVSPSLCLMIGQRYRNIRGIYLGESSP